MKTNERTNLMLENFCWMELMNWIHLDLYHICLLEVHA